ncbi:hypothetical protein [Methylobacterium oxalidis]|uniref:Lipoprotein n=1 Tax=Methylobacterium oxalidis TaxID=944322 RepID=A0A512J166_9HYPH|nr:hypothetical protein [Methylobacterium oxalidis]GEP03643.1 hypothetical protein MOX02_16810 [Methylobacterium oxalidis]GJE34350.1 hypothetical protein LDDCCGHA_4561 [Methylobacterium oxalidis]GLS64970.1 hypothetical protein GCM10007888_33510 [Methylobacterium oxalidis]
MRILRHLALGSAFALCAGIVGFACADRLDHPRSAPVLVRAPVPEPSATGSILPAPKEAAPPPKAAAPKIPNGFDTERLHALMRGDPIAPQRR